MLKRGLILLLLFAVFTGLEFSGFFRMIDPQVTRLLQLFIPRIFDIPLSLFSILGSAEITGLILVGIFVLVWLKMKKILWSLGLFLVLTGLELAGKFVLYHPGPPKYFFRYDLPFSTPTYVNSPYSFPSGHVSRTMFIVIVTLFLIGRLVRNQTNRKLLRLVLAAVVILMMVSRVYLGEHWTSDVIGGALLGSAMGFLAMVYY